MWTETDPEVLWQHQLDDPIWKNNGQPACLCQEEWDELFSNTCENITARVFLSIRIHGLNGDQSDPSRIRVAVFFRSQWHCGRPSWTLPLLRSFLWLQQKTYASICPTELFIRDMSIVRTLERVSEQRQKPSVSGVFLVIVIHIYDSLDDPSTLNLHFLVCFSSPPT